VHATDEGTDGVTPLAVSLRNDIENGGPIRFDRFMEQALYHPVHGYYRGGRDVFGRGGDFYTAEQLQPVFGILVAQVIEGLSDAKRVIELGAGRAEMADAFRGFDYLPVDWARNDLPERIDGVVFANEFFDALPVRLFRWTGAAWMERLVTADGDQFVFVDGASPDEAALRYLNDYTLSPGEDELLAETGQSAFEWLDRLNARMERGHLFAIDYGYTKRELVRFPQGTLMSYRKHTATPEVLEDPGAIDITAHVNFTALQQYAILLGWEVVRFETLAQTLLRAGEADQFEAAIAAESEVERVRRRLQLKTLLFGMGETFRTLLLRKGPK
jgi:SAM-dependent MidA family methyltransferase